MKKILLMIALMLFIGFRISGQKVKPVPESVRKTFSQKFPNIKRVIWDNSNIKEWEAEFRINRKEYSAIFDINGKWIKTCHEINKSEIPSAVKATLNKEFEGYKIQESEMCETAVSKVYQFELIKEADKIETIIDINGKIFQKNKSKD
jgi:hypothetical protein